MAKVLRTFASLDRFDLQRPEFGPGLEPVLPKEIDVVHACVMPEGEWWGIWSEVADATEPVFARPRHFLKAACGQRVRTYLPEPFDTAHALACRQCVMALS